MVVKPIKFFIFVAILEIEYFRIFDYMLQNNSGLFGSIPVVTKNLLIINLLFFLADKVHAFDQIFAVKDAMPKYLALFYFKSDYFYPHQFITSMFMHADFRHLFFNMFGVFMFGRTLETVWGPKRFLTYYLITGIGAAVLHMIIMTIRLYYIEIEVSPEQFSAFTTSLFSSPYAYMLGASGALFGILLGFGMLFPDAKLMIIPIPVPIKAKYFVIGYGVLELVQGVTDRAGDNVAHFAHLGGLLTGLILVLYWKKKGTLHGKFF